MKPKLAFALCLVAASCLAGNIVIPITSVGVTNGIATNTTTSTLTADIASIYVIVPTNEYEFVISTVAAGSLSSKVIALFTNAVSGIYYPQIISCGSNYPAFPVAGQKVQVLSSGAYASNEVAVIMLTY